MQMSESPITLQVGLRDVKGFVFGFKMIVLFISTNVMPKVCQPLVSPHMSTQLHKYTHIHRHTYSHLPVATTQRTIVWNILHTNSFTGLYTPETSWNISPTINYLLMAPRYPLNLGFHFPVILSLFSANPMLWAKPLIFSLAYSNPILTQFPQSYMNKDFISVPYYWTTPSITFPHKLHSQCTPQATLLWNLLWKKSQGICGLNCYFQSTLS